MAGRVGGYAIPGGERGTSGIHILMIAPEPCFQPRGTPFSVYHRIVALLRLGHRIDLATYPFGEQISLDGLRTFRSATIPGITNVKVGPSKAKIVLDLLLIWRCLGLLLGNRYDVIHTHEEAGLLGCYPGVARSASHTSMTCTLISLNNWATFSLRTIVYLSA